MIQNRLIVFCYAYMLGLVAAMVAPVDGRWLAILWIIPAVLLAGSGYLMTQESRPSRTPGAAASSVFWMLLILGAAALGYARFIHSDTIPDSRVGKLEMRDHQVVLDAVPDFGETCRLRVQKISPLESDLRFRLTGELSARVPILSEEGRPAMDEQGRWRFRKMVTRQISDIITVRAADPVGTEYTVDQPFNRILRAEVLEAPVQGRLNLYRISNHASSFVRAGRDQTPITILGRITQDPWVYGFKTVLSVTPAFIQYVPEGPFFKVEGGNVRITVDPSMDGYSQIARSDAFGYDLVARGGLSSASASVNPGGFDQRRYLSNYDVFGQMHLRQETGEDPPLSIIAPAGREPRRGNPLVEFSLNLRDRLLGVIKLTLPYPNSAFLGGVSLGMRYGLQNTECIYSDQAPQRGLQSLVGAHPLCRSLIADEFKSTGVNHVLAVSGLHVTIITVMLVGIFSLLRISRRVYVPLILLALVIFAIITGARPSTMRAVIMNSLFLLTWAYLDKGLRSSVLLGVPVAAFIILLQNPTILVDPSFTLSFGAILSLALLTTPCQDLLNRFKGNSLVALALLVALLIAAVILEWNLLTTFWFWMAFILLALVVFQGARNLDKKGVHLIGSRGFSDLPTGIGTFIAAQFAIQVGMMIPLSAYYFARWPVAGAFANLIAIPLIGVVLQLGMIACLLGLLPLVGIYLALVLNAANWVFTTGFLLLSHYFDHWFPYPYVQKPTLAALMVYYVLCALFIWHKPLLKKLHAHPRAARVIKPAALIGVALGFLLIAPWEAQTPPGLNVTILSVRYGSAIFIETPGGQKILVDAGHVQRDRGRANEAERNIIPYLSTRGYRELDAVILASPRPERAAGIASVLQHCRVKAFMAPAPFAELAPGQTFPAFRAALNLPEKHPYGPDLLAQLHEELAGLPDKPRQLALARVLNARRDTPLNRLAGTAIRRQTLQAGEVLFASTDKDGTPFSIQVLAPGTNAFTRWPLENRSLVLRVAYGDTAILITGDLHFDGQRALAEAYPPEALRSDVLLVPARGTSWEPSSEEGFKTALLAAHADAFEPLLNKVSPSFAVFEFGNPKPVLKDQSRTALRAYEITQRLLEDRLGADHILHTERDGALFIHSDGKTVQVKTQASAAMEDGVSELERDW